MPTDLTGTPTSLGIGTYNTSADAPSGLGFNAAMAQIDTLLAARVAKPSGIASGEVPVWNGSAFVRSSVTPVGAASLGTGTPDGTKVLRGTGAWVAGAAARVGLAVTQSIPNAGASNDIVLAASYVWKQDGAAAWAARGATGATVAVPDTGIYIATAFIQYAINATGVRELDIVASSAGNTNPFNAGSGDGTLPGWSSATGVFNLTAGDTLKMQTRQTSGAALNLNNAEIMIVRVA